MSEQFSPFKLPETFVKTVQGVHGEKGRIWLQQLPAFLQDIAMEWELTLQKPCKLSYHYVTQAYSHRNKQSVILKLGVPGNEVAQEIKALQAFAGHGCVDLLRADVERGILLLEHIEPGLSLNSVEDDEETSRIAAQVMHHLWQPELSHDGFATVDDWITGLQTLRRTYGGNTGPLPRQLVEYAEQVYTDLSASPAPYYLLHGDLHHDNILQSSNDSWKAIDPKGVIGEQAFEVSAFLLNPSLQPASVLQKRIEIFSEILDLNAERIRLWGCIRAVLSAWWTIEDGGDQWQQTIGVANNLYRLRK